MLMPQETPRATEFWMKAAAITAVLLGTILRCVRAATLGLNPDEALHLLACHLDPFERALAEMYRFHHPPLVLVLNYLVRPLLFSEFGARLIPVIAGSLLPAVVFVWLRSRVGMMGAFTALLVTALSPNLISLAAQVRSYTLAFLFVGLTLLWLDQGIDWKRLTRLGFAGIALSLGIMSDYSVALVCPAIGLYGFSRFHESGARRSYWIAWAGAMLLALATFGILYWFQVRHFQEVAQDFGKSWLKGGFRDAGEPMVVFLASASLKQFVYLFGSLAGGVFFLAAFSVGVLAGSRSWRLLLVAPFATGLVMALLQLLPFGRSRHSAIVSIIIAAGLALAAQRWLKSYPRFWLVAAPAMVALIFLTAAPDAMDLPPSKLDRHAMREAPEFLASVSPRRTAILATGGSLRLVSYYRLMSRQPPLQIDATRWDLASDEVESTFAQFRQRNGLRADEPFYFVEGGFFSVRFPWSEEAGPLRTFGPLRVWRISGR
jgi:hypothetical protein